MRRQTAAAVLAALATIACVGGAVAQQPGIPALWDAKERLAKPDLSALPRLRFLTTTDFPPFNYLDPVGRLSGFHVDLARAICAELAIADRCQIQALPWDELEAALLLGQGEAVLAGLAVTSENRTKFAFSRPYLRFPARFVVRKSSAIIEASAAALRGKRVGVVGGSAHAQLLRDGFAGIDIAAYPQQDALLTDLKAGKIEAAFGDGMQLSLWLKREDAADCCRFAGGPYLAPDYLGSGLAIATMPHNDQLIAALDAALQQLSAKGTFAELYLRYFPISFY
jgi:polar amino acid transport system substrate-binding protein